MATTNTIKTKVTEQFTITGDNGEVYHIQQHTRYGMKNVGGTKTEVLGSAYLLTSDGRGVVKERVLNCYSIPSLSIKALRQ